MRVFDSALIGAGPTGYAALTALRGCSGSLVVITGATPDPRLNGPAKFVSVAYERRKPACLAERTTVSGSATPVFASAEVGGMANYWGRQLQVYGCHEPWGQGQYLKTWKAYRAACDAVQADFEVIGGAPRQILGDDFETSEPRLLIGTKDAPDAGLETMANAVEKRFEEIGGVEVRSGRVQRIEAEHGAIRLELGDGTQIRARRAFLAAGVLGTATLLARSLPQVADIGFRDHAPYTIKCFRLDRALGRPHTYTNDGNFNALTLTRKKDGHCDIFATVYAVSQAPLSLLTTTIGLGPWLRGRRIGRLFDFLQPVRIWTPKTLMQICYLPRLDRVEASPAPDPELDNELQYLRDWLSSQGVRSTLGTTAPGQGFHYHRLTIGAERTPVDEVVKTAFRGRLRVIDASCLSLIGCPPPTLTAMAQAFVRVRHDLKN